MQASTIDNIAAPRINLNEQPSAMEEETLDTIDTTLRSADYLKKNEVPQSKLRDVLDDNARRSLENTSVGQVQRVVGNLIQLNADDTVLNCTEVLSKYKIGSAPVWDQYTNRYIGFVDDLDLAVFIINAFAQQYESHPHLYNPKELEESFMHPVRELINASKVDPFCPVDAKSSLQFVISNFLRYGIHRVPVCDNTGNVTGLLSQADVVKWLAQNTFPFTSILNQRLEEVGLDHGNVISVTNDAPLLRAFTTILTHKITGLAVVDMRNGELINNLSASDLKGVSYASVYKLEVPIHQIFMYGKKMPPVTCTVNTTVGEVIQLLVSTGVHRIYVVDPEKRPVNVITLTDILRLLSSNPYSSSNIPKSI